MRISKKTVLRIICWTAVAACMVMIFAFSSAKGEKSSALSGGICIKIARFFIRDFDGLPFEKQEPILSTLQFFVRKGGHVSEFLLLGVLSFLAMLNYPVRDPVRVLTAFGICLVNAASDEIHQLFVPDRSGQLTDVLIDCTGAAAGILLLFLISSAVVKKKNKKENERRCPSE